PRTRRERAALRRWSEGEDSLVRETQRYATLYLPERTVWYQQGRQGWEETGRDEHGLGEVPVVSLVNRGRLADRYGKSELTPALLSLSHAANKIATDMMVAAEFHAIPLRAIFGIGPEDLQDEQGNRLSALQVIMGRLLTLPTDDGNKIRPHEFSASSLANFHATLEALARRIVPLIGLPPDMVGLTSENPASAEARRAAEARLIKRAERKQVPFGSGWRRWARLVRRLQDGDWDPRARRIEVIWRDPATPTRSQAADAAIKLLAGGAITKRQAREDMGYTPGQIRRMEAEDLAEAERDPVRQIVDRMGGGRAEPVTANAGSAGRGRPLPAAAPAGRGGRPRGSADVAAGRPGRHRRLVADAAAPAAGSGDGRATGRRTDRRRLPGRGPCRAGHRPGRRGRAGPVGLGGGRLRRPRARHVAVSAGDRR